MSFPFYLEQRQETEGSPGPPGSTDVAGISPTTFSVEASTTTGTETKIGTGSQAEGGFPAASDVSMDSKASTGTDGASRSDATESTATSATSFPSNNRLNDGEVAGVAISCLVAGLIIGAVIAWQWHVFRAKGRSRHYRRRRRSEEGFRFMNQPRDATSVALEPSAKRVKLENVVLQPAPDKDILSDLGRLEDIIRQHVEALYHSDPVGVKLTTLAHALSALGISQDLSGFHAETVAGWCLKPGTRSGALKHVISHVLFRTIDWNSPGPLTLLPQPAVSFVTSIRPRRDNKDNLDGKHKRKVTRISRTGY